MKRTTLLLVLLAAALLFVWGCERNVTNEVVNEVAAANCFGCHNDMDGKLQQAEGEWNNSIHASGASIDYTNRGGTSDCVRCHDHQGFVEWITTGDINPPYENVSAIHCFTCHAPHTEGTLALRAVDPVTLPTNVTFDDGAANLCANCHQARSAFSATVLPYKLSLRFGPHYSNQADMLFGTGGFQYTGYTYTTDGHYAGIDNGCIGCHMGDPLVHAGYQIGGHSFNMREIEDTSVTLAAQCTPCHSAIKSKFDVNIDNEDYDGDGLTEGYQTELDGLLEDLKGELIDAGLWHAGRDAIDSSKTIASRDTLGALWNFVYVEEDRSRGMHNWDYTIGLIRSSRNYLATGDPNTPPSTVATKPKDAVLSAH